MLLKWLFEADLTKLSTIYHQGTVLQQGPSFASKHMLIYECPNKQFI